MTVQTTAGSTFAIADAAGAPATYDQAGYSAKTYLDVGEVVNMGEYGRVYTLVTHNPIGDRRTIKLKGSYDDGSMALQLGFDEDDTGQAQMIAARDDDGDFAIEVTHQDGAIDYFMAKIMSFTKVKNDVNTVYGANSDVQITHDIVSVAAP